MYLFDTHLSHFPLPEREFASTIAVGCSGAAQVGKPSHGGLLWGLMEMMGHPKEGEGHPWEGPRGTLHRSLVHIGTSGAVPNMPGIPCENKSDFFKERRSLKFDGAINILKSAQTVLLKAQWHGFFFFPLFWLLFCFGFFFPINA